MLAKDVMDHTYKTWATTCGKDSCIDETSCPDKTINGESSLSSMTCLKWQICIYRVECPLGKPEHIYFSPMQGQLHEKTVLLRSFY